MRSRTSIDSPTSAGAGRPVLQRSPQLKDPHCGTRRPHQDIVEPSSQFPRSSARFCGHWHQRRIYELARPSGGVTRVDVLNMENSSWGMACLSGQGSRRFASSRSKSAENRLGFGPGNGLE